MYLLSGGCVSAGHNRVPAQRVQGERRTLLLTSVEHPPPLGAICASVLPPLKGSFA